VKWLVTRALVGACAAGTQKTAAGSSARDLHSKIETLSAEIERERVAGGIHVPAEHWPHEHRCRPAETLSCTSSCTLSDSICDNAEKICELAQQLPGDAGADHASREGRGA
jgi:hypothetical protein